MKEYRCFLNKENKKISYPSLTIIEPLFQQKLSPLNLITNELNAGDIILVEYINDQIKRIYKSSDFVNLEQIYGEPTESSKIITNTILCWTKKIQIEKYITSIIENLTLQDLINNKYDLNMFEKELTKYLLICKNEQKFNLRTCRSVIFKTCKDVRIAEKIYLFMKNNPFNFFLHEHSDIKFNFEQWTVQVNYEC